MSKRPFEALWFRVQESITPNAFINVEKSWKDLSLGKRQ
jgi:hypothetical protein